MKDNQLSVIYEFVASNRKPKLSEIHCIWSSLLESTLQYDCLSLIWGGGFCIAKLFRTMMKFSNLFFLAFYMVKFLNHFMMTVVIKVYSVY